VSDKKITGAEDPYVEFNVGYDGGISATLSFDRAKRDGSIEHTTVEFPELEPEHLACIGSNARRTIHLARTKAAERMDLARTKAAERMDDAYNRIVTPGR
jgi:hypothetical protein